MTDPGPRPDNDARASDIKALLERVDAPDLAYYEFDRGGQATPIREKKPDAEATTAPPAPASASSAAAFDTRAFPAPEVHVRSERLSLEDPMPAAPDAPEAPTPPEPVDTPELPKLQAKPAPTPPPAPPPQASPPAPKPVAAPQPLPPRTKIPMPRPPIEPTQEAPQDAEGSERRLSDLFQRL